MESFGFLLALAFPFGFLSIAVFAIAAIIEGKTTMQKSLLIRNLYFHVASLITLGIAIGSLIVVLTISLQSWVFPNANNYSNFYGPPPSLYLTQDQSVEPTKAVPAQTEQLECESDCTLTATQKSNIELWKSSYTSWKAQTDNPNARRARDLVNALSFFVVSAPVFWFHFRSIRKKKDDDEGRSVIRPVYFYLVSFAALLMMVIAGGVLVNVGLKTWVIPEAGKVDNDYVRTMPSLAETPEMTAVQSITSCGEKCGIDNETVALADTWLADYASWDKTQNGTSQSQRQASTAIPFVLAGIPLFWYHWRVVRNEAKSKQNSLPPTNLS